MKKTASVKFRRIPIPVIKKAALKIVSAVHPEKIILFGSYAHGRPDVDSDVDFLLIVRENRRARQNQIYFRASKALDPYPFPCDILIRSANDISWRIKEGDFFLKEVMSKGRILYER